MARLATGSVPSDLPGRELLARLIPQSVSGVVAPLADALPGPPPAPAEAALVTNAVSRRQREFLAGRACAHAALAAIGCDVEVIGVGPYREPLWPEGVVGSIAHGGDWAGAVVALAGDTAGVGLDIEPLDPPLTPDVERLVLTEAERQRLPADQHQAAVSAKVVFTAKECVYKALFPSTGWRLEFSDVEIELDLAGGRWQGVLDDRFPLAGQSVAGRFEVVADHVFTAVVVAGGAVTAGGGRGRGGGR